MIAAPFAALLQGAGAGELLTAVLGMALTGLGFVIYKQRRSISIPAVAVTAVAAAAFNVMSTVAMTHLVPLTDGELRQLLSLQVGVRSM
jgi:putative effector of murein hydrolase